MSFTRYLHSNKKNFKKHSNKTNFKKHSKKTNFKKQTKNKLQETFKKKNFKKQTKNKLQETFKKKTSRNIQTVFEEGSFLLFFQLHFLFSERFHFIHSFYNLFNQILSL